MKPPQPEAWRAGRLFWDLAGPLCPECEVPLAEGEEKCPWCAREGKRDRPR